MNVNNCFKLGLWNVLFHRRVSRSPNYKACLLFLPGRMGGGKEGLEKLLITGNDWRSHFSSLLSKEFPVINVFTYPSPPTSYMERSDLRSNTRDGQRRSFRNALYKALPEEGLEVSSSNAPCIKQCLKIFCVHPSEERFFIHEYISAVSLSTGLQQIVANRRLYSVNNVPILPPNGSVPCYNWRSPNRKSKKLSDRPL